jgi:hypothetical protein
MLMSLSSLYAYVAVVTIPPAPRGAWSPWDPVHREHRLVCNAPSPPGRRRVNHVAHLPEPVPLGVSSEVKVDWRNMLRWFKDTATAAGITRKVWIHQLRHTAGTRAAEVGMSALEVAALLGHAQASTSERYIHLAAGAELERAERIAAQALGS